MKPAQVYISPAYMRGPRGGRRSGPPPPPPPRKIKSYMGSLAILVRFPWTFTKLPSQHSMFAHHRPGFSDIWILSPLIESLVRVRPPLTKLPGSAHVILSYRADMAIFIIYLHFRKIAIYMYKFTGQRFKSFQRHLPVARERHVSTCIL